MRSFCLVPFSGLLTLHNMDKSLVFTIFILSKAIFNIVINKAYAYLRLSFLISVCWISWCFECTIRFIAFSGLGSWMIVLILIQSQKLFLSMIFKISLRLCWNHCLSSLLAAVRIFSLSCVGVVAGVSKLW